MTEYNTSYPTVISGGAGHEMQERTNSPMPPPYEQGLRSTGSHLLAGGIAGTVEIFLMYPLDYSRLNDLRVASTLHVNCASLITLTIAITASPPQQSKPVFNFIIPPITVLPFVRATLRDLGPLAVYAGSSPVLLGGFAKVGVRFLVFERARRAMDGGASGEGSAVGLNNAWVSFAAGLFAGIAESLFVVIPAETIKTRIIANRRSPKRRFRGLLNTIAIIYRTEGLHGLYRGITPTMLRQGATSAIRFGVYTDFTARMRQFLGVQSLHPTYALLAGMAAGTCATYATMPLDVIKTRMQGPAGGRYRGVIDCARRIAREEGAMAFWRGTIPRLTRLSFSGGIVFACYSQIIKVLEGA